MSNTTTETTAWAAVTAVASLCIAVGALGGCKMTTEARIARENKERYAIEDAHRREAEFEAQRRQQQHEISMVMIGYGYTARQEDLAPAQ